MAISFEIQSAPVVERVVGKFKKLVCLELVAATFLFVAATGALADEPIHGRSTELSIEFNATNGEAWCGSRVKIQLTASKAVVFNDGSIAFQQMLGRIRAAVQTECPAVEAISFEGRFKKKTVYAGEMSRLANWRIVTLNPNTREPPCPIDIANDPDCRKRVEAYAIAVKLMQGEPFSRTEFTTMLEKGSANNLAWISGFVIGKLNIFSREELGGRFTTSKQFAEAIVMDIVNTCATESGAHEQQTEVDVDADIAQRSFNCRYANKPVAQNIIIVASNGAMFWVFSLWAEGTEMSAASDMAQRLVAAIKTNR